MDDVNPYNEPLDNIYHIFNRLSLDTRVKDNEFEEINLFEVNKLIDEINEKIDNIINVREDIIKEKHENDEAIVLLKNLKDSKDSQLSRCRVQRLSMKRRRFRGEILVLGPQGYPSDSQRCRDVR